MKLKESGDDVFLSTIRTVDEPLRADDLDVKLHRRPEEEQRRRHVKDGTITRRASRRRVVIVNGGRDVVGGVDGRAGNG